MESWKRNEWCGELTVGNENDEVTLNGWMHRQRDFGDLVFIDLRDRTGIVQVVVDRKDAPEALVTLANAVRSEYVLSVKGKVRKRTPGAENPNLKTGEIEVAVSEIEVLNSSRPLPFQVSDESSMVQVDEALRLKHRYLDLRRPKMYQMLELRHNAIRIIREVMHREGFLEIETPLFTKSTPEGARDYLVPYRLEPGLFYALPQSPQQYKQLLMVSGVERYFQIARCFRDEAQRADRQPEFTQFDVEMSFVEQEDILTLIEKVTVEVVSQLSDKEMLTPFPRYTYDESLRRFGNDKPDIRFGLELKELNDIVTDSEFAVFADTVKNGGLVKAVRYPGGAALSRKETDLLGEFCKEFGAKGLATIQVNEPNANGVKSALSKFLRPETIEAILQVCEAEADDLICIVADTERATVNNVLSRLRLEIGKRLNLRDPNKLYFSWITDFPLVEWNTDENRWEAAHHPFVMPYESDLPYFDTDPGKIRAQCYDIACNGTEWASGSIRIHRADVQAKVFSLLGIDEERQRERFGHILDAFSFGAPPHGGIAPGIDRLLMFLLDEPNIREVMAFPKMGLGYDPLMNAPSTVDDAQLKELGLTIVKKPGANG